MINSRRKGHQAERNLAKEFQELGFPKARRHLEYHEIDALMGIDLQGTQPFAVQSKKRADYVSVKKLELIQRQNGYTIPLLITAADHKKPIAVMYWKDLKPLIRNYVKNKT